jgi:DNA-binding MarR family transcriptional regulator
VKAEERKRVQRITDWDDARYSFLPARAADDLRLTLVHLRVLVYLGRVNNNNGWTELSQKATAGRWGCARVTINGAIKSLVEWGYVEKKSQAETNTALCLYRLLIDKPESSAPAAPKPEPKKKKGKGGVSSVDDTSQDAAVSSTGDTCVEPETTRVSSGDDTNIEDQRSGDLSPPKSPAGGRRGRAKVSSEVEEVIAAIAADVPDDAQRAVLNDFLAPLIRQRQFTAPSLEGGARALLGFITARAPTADELRKVRDQLLIDRIATVKPSDVESAIRTVVASRPLPRVLQGDAALMQRWPAVLAELEKQIGAESTQQVFSTFAVDRLERQSRTGRLIAYVSTHADWARKHVELSLSAQFRAAMIAVYPGVDTVWIETRKAAA